MKKVDVQSLVQQGILDISATTLDAKEAYQVFKFKKGIKAVFDDIEKDRLALLESTFGDNYAEEIQALNELKQKGYDAGSGPSERYSDLMDKESRVISQITALLQEDAHLEPIIPIPYEQWHLLIKQNVKLGGYIEMLLENILWAPPAE